MNIVLVGMPGSGKSSVSEILANSLNMSVVDTDGIIVSRFGEINKIFADHGEEYFRGLESKVIAEVSLMDNAVISTGGGSILKSENVENLKKNGKIVYLKTELKTLVARTLGDTSRPLLAGDCENKLRSLLNARASLYEACADLVVETDDISSKEIAEKITELVR